MYYLEQRGLGLQGKEGKFDASWDFKTFLIFPTKCFQT